MVNGVSASGPLPQGECQHSTPSCYRIKEKTSTGEQISYVNFDDYLCDQRACTHEEGSYAPAICNVGLFEQLTDKWMQLNPMVNKKAYANVPILIMHGALRRLVQLHGAGKDADEIK